MRATSWCTRMGRACRRRRGRGSGRTACPGRARNDPVSPRRAWRQGEISRHHLIDPHTGEPVENDLREVTVAASSCKEAEVGATAAFVLGSDLGQAFLRRHRLAGRLTRADRTRVFAGAWPSPWPEAA